MLNTPKNNQKAATRQNARTPSLKSLLRDNAWSLTLTTTTGVNGNGGQRAQVADLLDAAEDGRLNLDWYAQISVDADTLARHLRDAGIEDLAPGLCWTAWESREIDDGGYLTGGRHIIYIWVEEPKAAINAALAAGDVKRVPSGGFTASTGYKTTGRTTYSGIYATAGEALAAYDSNVEEAAAPQAPTAPEVTRIKGGRAGFCQALCKAAAAPECEAYIIYNPSRGFDCHYQDHARGFQCHYRDPAADAIWAAPYRRPGYRGMQPDEYNRVRRELLEMLNNPNFFAA